jgi:hypothetical protein
MSAKVVRGLTEKLPLTGADWLLVKKRLNVGEQRAYFARLYIAGADGQFRVNPLETRRATVVAYLLDWNLVEEDGSLLPSVRNESPETVMGILDSLDPEMFGEICDAIETHIGKEQAARDQEKNARTATRNDAQISRSPSEPVGASTGSVN